MKIWIIVFAVLLIIYVLSTYIMFVMISKKSANIFLPMTKNIEKSLESYKKKIDSGSKWVYDKINNNEVKDVYIKSKDNLKLHAIFIENDNSKGIFLETHGYRSVASRDLYPSCFNYYNMGYSLLIVDSRASNLSEGNYITFGVKESEDILCWVNYLNNNYKNTDIYLVGISMGASSILMSLDRINNKMGIKGVIVDSGYVSAYDEVLYCIKKFFHINGQLFIGFINLWCKLFADFDLKEKDTISSINKSKIPILFIHGEEDDFIPTYNSINNYNKYDGPKELKLFPKANHGISYLVDSKKYVNVIKRFLKNNK